MKRHGNLWDEITSMENLRHAHQLAKRGKGHYRAVQEVEKGVEGHLRQIRKMLRNKTFSTGIYNIEDRIEGGKMRRIYKLPYYPDRIVHHALMAVVGPILMRSLIRDTFQSLPNRGTSDARRRVQKMMREAPQRYALKIDIKKYYPSVKNSLLKHMLTLKIKCTHTLWLLYDIIDSILGLPIGSLVSQYLGNFFLYLFDWWVKQTLKVKYFFRYCDDMIFFSNSKKQLRVWRVAVQNKLAAMQLTLKSDWQIVDVAEQGVDFVGHVFFTTRTRLRKSIACNLKSAARKASARSAVPVACARTLVAYQGWVMRCNAKQLWRIAVPARTRRAANIHFSKQPLRGAV